MGHLVSLLINYSMNIDSLNKKELLMLKNWYFVLGICGFNDVLSSNCVSEVQ